MGGHRSLAACAAYALLLTAVASASSAIAPAGSQQSTTLTTMAEQVAQYNVNPAQQSSAPAPAMSLPAATSQFQAQQVRTRTFSWLDFKSCNVQTNVPIFSDIWASGPSRSCSRKHLAAMHIREQPQCTLCHADAGARTSSQHPADCICTGSPGQHRPTATTQARSALSHRK